MCVSVKPCSRSGSRKREGRDLDEFKTIILDGKRLRHHQDLLLGTTLSSLLGSRQECRLSLDIQDLIFTLNNLISLSAQEFLLGLLNQASEIDGTSVGIWACVFGVKAVENAGDGRIIRSVGSANRGEVIVDVLGQEIEQGLGEIARAVLFGIDESIGFPGMATHGEGLLEGGADISRSFGSLVRMRLVVIREMGSLVGSNLDGFRLTSRVEVNTLRINPTTLHTRWCSDAIHPLGIVVLVSLEAMRLGTEIAVFGNGD